MDRRETQASRKPRAAPSSSASKSPLVRPSSSDDWTRLPQDSTYWLHATILGHEVYFQDYLCPSLYNIMVGWFWLSSRTTDQLGFRISHPKLVRKTILPFAIKCQPQFADTAIR